MLSKLQTVDEAIQTIQSKMLFCRFQAQDQESASAKRITHSSITAQSAGLAGKQALSLLRKLQTHGWKKCVHKDQAESFLSARRDIEFSDEIQRNISA